MVYRAHNGPATDPEKIEVNHRNLNRADNKPANLEWVTPAENMWHARLHNKKRRVPTSQRKKIQMRCMGDSVWRE